MKNKNMVLFIGVGFVVTIAIWGFVGGCGTTGVTQNIIKTEQQGTRLVQTTREAGAEFQGDEDASAEGLILDKSSIEETGEPVPGTSAVQTRHTYIVTQGDTLWKISKKFGVSVSSIKEANSMKSDNISAGQNIIIPGIAIKEVKKTEKPNEPAQVKKEAPAEVRAEVHAEVHAEIPDVSEKKTENKPGMIVYKVRKNDSLWRIAQIYGTTADKIASINKLSKNAQLMPGQEILVPSNE